MFTSGDLTVSQAADLNRLQEEVARLRALDAVPPLGVTWFDGTPSVMLGDLTAPDVGFWAAITGQPTSGLNAYAFAELTDNPAAPNTDPAVVYEDGTFPTLSGGRTGNGSADNGGVGRAWEVQGRVDVPVGARVWVRASGRGTGYVFWWSPYPLYGSISDNAAYPRHEATSTAGLLRRVFSGTGEKLATGTDVLLVPNPTLPPSSTPSNPRTADEEAGWWAFPVAVPPPVLARITGDDDLTNAAVVLELNAGVVSDATGEFSVLENVVPWHAGADYLFPADTVVFAWPRGRQRAGGWWAVPAQSATADTPGYTNVGQSIVSFPGDTTLPARLSPAPQQLRGDVAMKGYLRSGGVWVTPNPYGVQPPPASAGPEDTDYGFGLYLIEAGSWYTNPYSNSVGLCASQQNLPAVQYLTSSDGEFQRVAFGWNAYGGYNTELTSDPYWHPDHAAEANTSRQVWDFRNGYVIDQDGSDIGERVVATENDAFGGRVVGGFVVRPIRAYSDSDGEILSQSVPVSVTLDSGPPRVKMVPAPPTGRKYLESYNGVVRWEDGPIPDPPPEGTYTLKSVNGILQWVADPDS